MLFSELNLISPLLKALESEGYTTPTPIQAQAIPFILKRRDILGCAQTGTGKTAAFSIPILQILTANAHQAKASKFPKVLILTPTRELALQIGESLTAYGQFTPIRSTIIFGGVSQQSQVSSLQRGTDILVATPGRLLDLLQQNILTLKEIGIFVLDEADRMLDMGFVNDVKKIIRKLPEKRQTLFFSATMPSEIEELADSLLKDPAYVEVTPVSSTVDTIQQHVFLVDAVNKKQLLQFILKDKSIESALVFTRTKHGADRVARDLNALKITAEAIHGNKSQNARQRALHNFKTRETRVLVATDIAARGIDVDNLSHVINYELPNVPETYVHRIGRTGRAGASGIALSFCSQEEWPFLKDIEKTIQKKLDIVQEHPFPIAQIEEKPTHQNVLSVAKIPSSSDRGRQKKRPFNKKTTTKKR